MYNIPLYNDELYGVQLNELQPVDDCPAVALEGLTSAFTVIEPVTMTDSARVLITAFVLAESVILNDWNTVEDSRSNQNWHPEH